MNVFKPIAALIISLIPGISHPQSVEIAVIVNASGPLVNVSSADIKDIYLGEKRFLDGIKLMPLLYREGSIKEAFLKETVQMTQKEYKLYWTKKIFQEGIPIPKTPSGSAEIITIVRDGKGGIGFLPKDEIKDLSEIKVIKAIK